MWRGHAVQHTRALIRQSRDIAAAPPALLAPPALVLMFPCGRGDGVGAPSDPRWTLSPSGSGHSVVRTQQGHGFMLGQGG